LGRPVPSPGGPPQPCWRPRTDSVTAEFAQFFVGTLNSIDRRARRRLW